MLILVRKYLNDLFLHVSTIHAHFYSYLRYIASG